MVDARIVRAEVTFYDRALVTPLVLSRGPITALLEARVRVDVRVGQSMATGRGSIYLSEVWAWPEDSPTEQRRGRMRRVCEHLANCLVELTGDRPAHPLELGLRLHWAVHESSEFSDVPPLAKDVCLSPFDAALHDAVGVAVGRSALDLYDQPVACPTADAAIDIEPGGAIAIVHQLLDRPAARELPAWWVVNAKDDPSADVTGAVTSGGYRCFKVKLTGRDVGADLDRITAVHRAAKAAGVADPQMSADSNEGNPDAESVEAFLRRLEQIDPAAYASLKYLEQPTGRDIRRHAFDWRRVATRRPVLLDEGMARLDDLRDASCQHWSGLAIKTCKGHSLALLSAAWAHNRHMKLAVQDLTNPGFAAIQSALIASRIPNLNGIEMNSLQFTPAANHEWLPALAGLFQVRNGVHRLPAGHVAGLGSNLVPGIA